MRRVHEDRYFDEWKFNFEEGSTCDAINGQSSVQPINCKRKFAADKAGTKANSLFDFKDFKDTLVNVFLS